MLDSWAFDDTLSAAEVELAERFAHLWFFRYVTRLPLLRPPQRLFALKTFRDLAPGGDAVMEHLCECLVTGAPFIDLNATRTMDNIA